MKAIVLAFCLFAATYAAPTDVDVGTAEPTVQAAPGGAPTILPDGCRITSHLPNGQYTWQCKQEWKTVKNGNNIPYCKVPPPTAGVNPNDGSGFVEPPGGSGGGMFGLGDFTGPGGTGLGFDATNFGKGPLVGAGGSVGPGGYSKSVTLGGVKVSEQAHIPGVDNVGGFKGIGTDVGIGGQPGTTAPGGTGLPVPIPFGK